MGSRESGRINDTDIFTNRLRNMASLPYSTPLSKTSLTRQPIRDSERKAVLENRLLSHSRVSTFMNSSTVGQNHTPILPRFQYRTANFATPRMVQPEFLKLVSNTVSSTYSDPSLYPLGVFPRAHLIPQSLQPRGGSLKRKSSVSIRGPDSLYHCTRLRMMTPTQIHNPGQSSQGHGSGTLYSSIINGTPQIKRKRDTEEGRMEVEHSISGTGLLDDCENGSVEKKRQKVDISSALCKTPGRNLPALKSITSDLCVYAERISSLQRTTAEGNSLSQDQQNDAFKLIQLLNGILSNSMLSQHSSASNGVTPGGRNRVTFDESTLNLNGRVVSSANGGLVNNNGSQTSTDRVSGSQILTDSDRFVRSSQMSAESVSSSQTYADSVRGIQASTNNDRNIISKQTLPDSDRTVIGSQMLTDSVTSSQTNAESDINQQILQEAQRLLQLLNKIVDMGRATQSSTPSHMQARGRGPNMIEASYSSQQRYQDRMQKMRDERERSKTGQSSPSSITNLSPSDSPGSMNAVSSGAVASSTATVSTETAAVSVAVSSRLNNSGSSTLSAVCSQSNSPSQISTKDPKMLVRPEHLEKDRLTQLIRTRHMINEVQDSDPNQDPILKSLNAEYEAVERRLQAIYRGEAVPSRMTLSSKPVTTASSAPFTSSTVPTFSGFTNTPVTAATGLSSASTVSVASDASLGVAILGNFPAFGASNASGSFSTAPGGFSAAAGVSTTAAGGFSTTAGSFSSAAGGVSASVGGFSEFLATVSSTIATSQPAGISTTLPSSTGQAASVNSLVSSSVTLPAYSATTSGSTAQGGITTTPKSTGGGGFTFERGTNQVLAITTSSFTPTTTTSSNAGGFYYNSVYFKSNISNTATMPSASDWVQNWQLCGPPVFGPISPTERSLWKMGGWRPRTSPLAPTDNLKDSAKPSETFLSKFGYDVQTTATQSSSSAGPPSYSSAINSTGVTGSNLGPAATTTGARFSPVFGASVTSNASATTSFTPVFGGLANSTITSSVSTSGTVSSASIFGGFGKSSTATTTGGLFPFGASVTSASASSIPMFGALANNTIANTAASSVHAFGTPVTSTTITTPSIFGGFSVTTQNSVAPSFAFGSNTTNAAATNSTSLFGAKSITTNSTAGGGFSFGALSTTTSATTTNNFTLGNSAPNISLGTAASFAPIFGTNNAAKTTASFSPMFGANAVSSVTNAASTQPLIFGAAPAVTAPNAMFGVTTFAAPATTTSSAAPMFGASNPFNSQANANPFKFGAASSNGFPASSTAPTYGFGGSQNTASVPGFGNSNLGGVPAFGAATTTASSLFPMPNNALNGTAASAFGTGNSMDMASGTPGLAAGTSVPFKFGPANQSAPNLFQFGGTSNNNSAAPAGGTAAQSSPFAFGGQGAAAPTGGFGFQAQPNPFAFQGQQGTAGLTNGGVFGSQPGTTAPGSFGNPTGGYGGFGTNTGGFGTNAGGFGTNTGGLGAPASAFGSFGNAGGNTSAGFGSPAAPALGAQQPSNLFTIGTGGSQQRPTSKIATRRTHRK